MKVLAWASQTAAGECWPRWDPNPTTRTGTTTSCSCLPFYDTSKNKIEGSWRSPEREHLFCASCGHAGRVYRRIVGLGLPDDTFYLFSTARNPAGWSLAAETPRLRSTLGTHPGEGGGCVTSVLQAIIVHTAVEGASERRRGRVPFTRCKETKDGQVVEESQAKI